MDFEEPPFGYEPYRSNGFLKGQNEIYTNQRGIFDFDEQLGVFQFVDLQIKKADSICQPF